MRQHLMNPESAIIALAWYRPDQWALLRAMSADAEVLEDVYDSWLAFASQQQRDLEGRGFTVRRVDVDVAELVRWCEQAGKSVDASARAEFACQKLKQST